CGTKPDNGHPVTGSGKMCTGQCIPNGTCPSGSCDDCCSEIAGCKPQTGAPSSEKGCLANAKAGTYACQGDNLHECQNDGSLKLLYTCDLGCSSSGNKDQSDWCTCPYNASPYDKSVGAGDGLYCEADGHLHKCDFSGGSKDKAVDCGDKNCAPSGRGKS